MAAHTHGARHTCGPRHGGSFTRTFAVLFCFVAGVAGLQPLPCESDKQLFLIHGDLHGALTHFVDLYTQFARNRPKVVADYVKAVQVKALSQDFLAVIEAFRLLVCYKVCAAACPVKEGSTGEMTLQVPLVERLDDLKLDLESAANTDVGAQFVANSNRLLREAKEYAATLLANIPPVDASEIDWGQAMATCVTKLISQVMFPALRIVSLSYRYNESHTILEGAFQGGEEGRGAAAGGVSYTTTRACVGGAPDCTRMSFEMLSSLATDARSLRLLSGPGTLSTEVCSPEASPHLLTGVMAKWPRQWLMLAEDGSRVPRVMRMLEHVDGRDLELSHVFFALRPTSRAGFLQGYSCEGEDLDFDPTLCFESQGWGGYVYAVGVHPPLQAELHVLGRGLGDSSQSGPASYLNVARPYGRAEEVETLSVEHLFYKLDFIFRQASEPSPDIFFLHPAVHNCHAMEYLFSGTAFKPKILFIPINPLIPPPFELMPQFDLWWHRLRPALRASPLTSGWAQGLEANEVEAGAGDEDAGESVVRMMDEYIKPSIWFAQCSLAAVDAALARMRKKRFRYALHHVHQGFAVYVREDLMNIFAGDGLSMPMSHWLEGWFCNPLSRFFSRLEAVAGADMVKLADATLHHDQQTLILCDFIVTHHIPIQRSNMDCASVADHPEKSRSWKNDAVGKHSCVAEHQRGWGNDGNVFDSVQRSAAACEAHCVAAQCKYWTFDPTAFYGQQLCWIWIRGGPAEIKAEHGWVSGDMDCASGPGSSASYETSQPQDQEPTGEGLGEASSMASVADAGPARGNRGLLKQWAAEQAQEIPGMRYFLESGHRGRCVQGFCECFPPHRGPLCDQHDGGAWDDHRNFSAVLHYLTSDSADDVEDIVHSLPRLWQRYNQWFDYPVVVFNDGLSLAHRKQIIEVSENRVWFAFVEDYLDVPDMLLQNPQRKAKLDDVKWSLGYRGMCRFRSGTIFLQPVMRGFHYAMTLDTDGYFPADLPLDPIAAMHEGGFVYTFSHLLMDAPGAVRHFWEYTLMYMAMKGIHPRGTPILEQFVREEDLQWSYKLYMNDIEIVQLEWFRSDPYQDYFRFLDSVGGFWLHRWGDHALRTIAVGMWLEEEKVYEMDIPYGHQNYCKCSQPNLECVREGTVGGEPAHWWTCRDVGSVA